jgi:hypothetical protein
MINISLDLIFLKRKDNELEIVDTISINYDDNTNEFVINELLRQFNDVEDVTIAELIFAIETYPQGKILRSEESDDSCEWVTLARFQKVTNNNKTFWITV